MKIGFVGLGKLGLPCAMASENVGHEVVGYDPDPRVAKILETRLLPYKEEGSQELLDHTNIKLVTHDDLVRDCDLIFVAVQTPHDPMYEGVTRIPDVRVDFNYTYLEKSITELAAATQRQGREANVIIISTVLPGTVDEKIRPLLGDKINLCYNPFFIAMGTTRHDFTHPEFVLFGVDNPSTADKAETFYKTIHNRPFYRTTIKNAELIKVSYNTFISTKIAFVNTLMEVCHKTGCDVDAVTGALQLATDRLISPKYMTGGMGDGGGCHPRDNIALSWLARKLDLSYDLFDAIMMSREAQTDWFVELILAEREELPVVILGKAFKEETNLTIGSPSILLKNLLLERDVTAEMYDHVVDGSLPILTPSLFFLGTRHSAFSTLAYPSGSVVIDPFRFVSDQAGVKVIRLGQAKK